MNKKTIVLKVMLLAVVMVFGQTQKTIKVIVPEKTDEVYITGNQKTLGNWKPNQVKMDKVSDYERAITVTLNYPAEFKFTKGNWNQEGIVKTVENNPNLKIDSTNSKSIFNIKGWSDNIDGESLGLAYGIEFLPSNFVNKGRNLKIVLPKNYDSKKKYPVVYITDGGTTNFNAAKNYLETFSGKGFDMSPEVILVGIVHGSDEKGSNRNKDLDVYYKTSGKKFKDFLFKELVPHINKSYSTSGFNVMIGHSNGAEYNHFLFLEKDNPFRAFLSISTNFYAKDVRKEMGESMKNYQGKPMYYFVSTGEFDSPDRTQAGNDYQKIYASNKNDGISFKKMNYKKGHVNMVPESLFDGLQFIFQDYNNASRYTSFQSYKENYLRDQKEIYGLELNYSLDQLDAFLTAILERKNEKDLDEYFDFVEEHKLWNNFVGNGPGGLDDANKGNMYFFINSYKKSALAYTQAFEQFGITVEPAVFYYNHQKMVQSFYKAEMYDELMELLVKSRNKLADHPEYTWGNNKKMLLAFNFQIAKLNKKHKINRKEGRRAVQYCRDNYIKNRYFTKEALNQL